MYRMATCYKLSTSACMRRGQRMYAKGLKKVSSPQWVVMKEQLWVRMPASNLAFGGRLLKDSRL